MNANQKNFAKRTISKASLIARAAFALMLFAAGAGLASAGQFEEPVENAAASAPVQSVRPPVDRALPVSTSHDDAPLKGGRDPDLVRKASHETPAKLEIDLRPSQRLQSQITRRYSDPALVRLVRTLSTGRALSLYREAMDLIDSRHVAPTSYAARARHGIENVLHAVGNRAFLQANGLSPSREQLAAFRHELSRRAAQITVRTAADARNLMYAAMDLAYRDLGLRPASVALEFVYGAANSLDRYSTFVPLMDSQASSVSLEEQVVGIGVEIKEHESGVIVVRALRGGPAEEAGLQRGDVIVSVNGRSLAGRSLDYAVEQITGAEGTAVLIVFERDGRRQPPVSLVRRRVEVSSVSEIRMLDEQQGVAYIKLERFVASSEEEMDRALWSLYRKGMKALVLDLRGNPGGLLTTAIELSDKFLPQGTIVSTRGRTAADNSFEQAIFEKTWKVPLTVLIDEYSASASEIFAAAIQENQRGLIVGRPSYGKGTVQTHFPLRTVSGNLKLTTAYFYSPTGRKMAGSGVNPDILVERRPEQPEVVPLLDDPDVKAALNVAAGSRAQELAASQLRSNAHGGGGRLGS